jgi:acetylornithine deacetylase/succinyl-diaminopimelate desuccinylase-like protein
MTGPIDTSWIAATWDDEIVPTLVDYIRVPNVSPAYEPEWAELGHMETATEMLRSWAERRELQMSIEVHRLVGRTPVIMIEVPPTGGGSVTDTVLLYGHLDKQPEMDGWDEGKGPWLPVMIDGRLYGRGGADDGYAMFASLTAIEAVQRASGPHTRLIVMIEASEESGSPDLPAYIDHLADQIGAVSLVICLDSGAGDYDHLWVTTSLRGLVAGTLTVDVLTEGVHSGSASGVVPSSFRILRRLLDRVEDSDTGEVTLPEMKVPISESRRDQIVQSAPLLGDSVSTGFPLVEGMRAMGADDLERIVNRTWKATLSVVGIDGAPAPGLAGNVLRPRTRAQLSFRLPPTCDPDAAAEAIERTLTTDPPYGARVRFTDIEVAPGWAAPELAPWLSEALDRTGSAHFGSPAGFQGEGGSIPFMGMLGERFPEAHFVIAGVLGPGSNAHGPNEFLDIEMGKRLTACVADLLISHATR